MHHNIKIIAFISYHTLSYHFFLLFRLFFILCLLFLFFNNSGLLLAMFFRFLLISYTSRLTTSIFIYIFYIFMHTLYILVFPGGKDGRCVGLTTLPTSRADCHEIWEPQLPGTLRTCPVL